MDNFAKEQIWTYFRTNLMASLYDCMAHIQRNATTGEERQMALNECYNYFSDVISCRPEWRAEGFRAALEEKRIEWRTEWDYQTKNEWLKALADHNEVGEEWKQEWLKEIEKHMQEKSIDDQGWLKVLANHLGKST